MTKAERTRQLIIEKSATLINKKGMAGTSMQDIMLATQLAKGGIYGNFESKDEICLESFSYLASSLSRQLDKAMLRGTTAKEKLFHLLDMYAIRLTDGGCPLLNFGTEADDTHPLMKERVRKAIQVSQKRIFDILFAGIAAGEISSKMNAKHFSIKTFALIEGAILCRRLLGSNEQMHIVIEEIKKEFRTYLK